MKTQSITTIIAALCAMLPLSHAEEQKSSASSSVTTNSDGTATVTIEVNGKKETKTFKLGDGQPFAFNIQNGNAVAVAGGGGEKKPAKMEKETWLGVAIEPVREEVRAQLPLKEGEGLTVTHVMPESPAAKAGIERLDILTRLDDQILVTAEQLSALVRVHKPGDKVKIASLRKGEQRDVEVTLEEHERPVAQDDVVRMFGGPNGVLQFDGKNWDLKKGEIRKQLQDMKQKFPGMIVDKKAWIVGPDGVKNLIGGDGNADEILKMTRKYLDDAKLPEGVRGEIQKAVEEAFKSVQDSLKQSGEKDDAATGQAHPGSGDKAPDPEKKP